VKTTFRVVLALVLVALMVLGGGQSAQAAMSWCEEDPIIYFADGRKVNIAVAVPKDRLSQLLGPVRITLTVPKNAPIVRIEPLYAGYFHEEVVVVVDETRTWNPARNNDIWVDVVVPAKSVFWVRANAWGDSTRPRLVDGWSNYPFKFKQTLAP
jgi:hypothetical protein